MTEHYVPKKWFSREPCTHNMKQCLFWQRQAMSSSKIPLVYSKCISNEHHLIHIRIQIKYDKFTIRLIDLLSY